MMTIAEVRAYLDSAEFNRRSADVLARQESGEVLDIPALATALGVPVSFMHDCMMATAAILDEARAARRYMITSPGRALNGPRGPAQAAAGCCA